MHERHLTERIMASLEDAPVVFIRGPRQSGKSTLAQAIAKRGGFAGNYRTFDDLAVRNFAQKDPEGFVASLSHPAVIDEAQRVPEVAIAIKAAVDSDRRPGRFLLTGSVDVLALPAIAGELVGRAALHILWPLSQGEMAGVRETFVDRLFDTDWRPAPVDEGPGPNLFERIASGGFPEVQAIKPGRRGQWFSSYLDLLIQRDIRDLANVERLTDLPDLLSLLAARSGQLLNHADLARTLEIPQSTLKRHVALMEAAFLTQRLPAWFGNFEKRLAKAPKTFVADTGLLLHLLNLEADHLDANRGHFGHALESFVVAEIAKQIGWSDRRCRLYHFRTHAGREVDLVIEGPGGRIAGIEVKASTTVRAHDLKGLEALAEIAGDRFVRGVLLYTGNLQVPAGRNLLALPIEQLWS